MNLKNEIMSKLGVDNSFDSLIERSVDKIDFDKPIFFGRPQAFTIKGKQVNYEVKDIDGGFYNSGITGKFELCNFKKPGIVTGRVYLIKSPASLEYIDLKFTDELFMSLRLGSNKTLNFTGDLYGLSGKDNQLFKLESKPINVSSIDVLFASSPDNQKDYMIEREASIPVYRSIEEHFRPIIIGNK